MGGGQLTASVRALLSFAPSVVGQGEGRGLSAHAFGVIERLREARHHWQLTGGVCLFDRSGAIRRPHSPHEHDDLQKRTLVIATGS
jgi:hypothetical protein